MQIMRFEYNTDVFDEFVFVAKKLEKVRRVLLISKFHPEYSEKKYKAYREMCEIIVGDIFTIVCMIEIESMKFYDGFKPLKFDETLLVQAKDLLELYQSQFDALVNHHQIQKEDGMTHPEERGDTDQTKNNFIGILVKLFEDLSLESYECNTECCLCNNVCHWRHVDDSDIKYILIVSQKDKELRTLAQNNWENNLKCNSHTFSVTKDCCERYAVDYPAICYVGVRD